MEPRHHFDCRSYSFRGQIEKCVKDFGFEDEQCAFPLHGPGWKDRINISPFVSATLESKELLLTECKPIPKTFREQFRYSHSCCAGFERHARTIQISPIADSDGSACVNGGSQVERQFFQRNLVSQPATASPGFLLRTGGRSTTGAAKGQRPRPRYRSRTTRGIA